MLSSAEITRAGELIRAGWLVAVPTETVYGLAADATNPKAVASIYAAKGRPDFNPLIVHVPDLVSAEAYGVFSADARRLAQRFWPGPLTIVVPARAGNGIAPGVTAGLETVAIRVPDHPIAQALLAAAARPLAAPSANPSGRISPTTAAHVVAGLGDQVAMILDGGAATVGVESTIVDFSGDSPRLLRPGGIAREAIEAEIGPIMVAAGDATVTAPGMLASHYAPRLPIRLNAAAPVGREALLAFGSPVPGGFVAVRNLSPNGDLADAAANLFAHLHDLDQSGADRIAAMPVPSTGLGLAINDRLARAAHPRE